MRKEPAAPRFRRLHLWLACTALSFWAFIAITAEMLDASRMQDLDAGILLTFERLRTPLLNIIAINLTSLGSMTLVVLHSALALMALLLVGDRLAAWQLVTASAGAEMLTWATKRMIERPRPEVVPRLVEVAGFSYPSGHSLSAAAMYLTIGILTARRFPRMSARLALIGATIGVVTLVGFSRVYLGVHYPSDVASGMFLGASWAFSLAAGFSWLADRRRRRDPG